MTSAQGGGLHHSVLTRIGADLTTGRLAAGDVFSMEQIEARYGVSRTVVREVVKVLESIGVASSRRRVGVTIQPESSWEALSPVIIHWRLEGPQRLAQLREVSELRRGVEPVDEFVFLQQIACTCISIKLFLNLISCLPLSPPSPSVEVCWPDRQHLLMQFCPDVGAEAGERL